MRKKRRYKRATRLERSMGFGYRKGHFTHVGCATLLTLPLIVGAVIVALRR
jgi:hypothetical protein